MRQNGPRHPRRSQRDASSKRSCAVHTKIHTIDLRATPEGARYEWDGAKEKRNLQKHGLYFSDVVGVFEDDLALSLENPEAVGERRFVVTGRDFRSRIVTVVYTWRGDTLRLISARRASRRERAAYEGGL